MNRAECHVGLIPSRIRHMIGAECPTGLIPSRIRRTGGTDRPAGLILPTNWRNRVTSNGEIQRPKFKRGAKPLPRHKNQINPACTRFKAALHRQPDRKRNIATPTPQRTHTFFEIDRHQRIRQLRRERRMERMVRHRPAVDRAAPTGRQPMNGIRITRVADQPRVVAQLAAGAAALDHQPALRRGLPVGA